MTAPSLPRWLAGCSLVGAVVVPVVVTLLAVARANAEYEASRGDRDDADRLAPRWVG